MLKPPRTNCLKLSCDKLLSTVAFKLNLCRYTAASASSGRGLIPMEVYKSANAGGGSRGRGLHLFPFPLNLSLLCPFSLNLSLLCPPCNPK